MRVWYWLVELPAAIVTVWIAVYRWFLVLSSIALFGMIVIVLGLYWGAGIRWGW